MGRDSEQSILPVSENTSITPDSTEERRNYDAEHSHEAWYRVRHRRRIPARPDAYFPRYSGNGAGRRASRLRFPLGGGPSHLPFPRSGGRGDLGGFHYAQRIGCADDAPPSRSPRGFYFLSHPPPPSHYVPHTS